MRLKENSDSWKARGIIRRDYRHTHAGPEVIQGKKRRPRSKKKRLDHKHIWVEVSYKEYISYRDKTRHRRDWYWDLNFEAPGWTDWHTYYVCAECLDTKSKVDHGKRRAFYWK